MGRLGHPRSLANTTTDACSSADCSALDMFPDEYLLIANLWGLVEISLAAVAGAWLYQRLHG